MKNLFQTPSIGGLSLSAVVLALSMATAGAQNFPGNGGPVNSVDPVTGYRCATNFCDVLRLPQSNCICVKQNPSEQKLSNLRLQCSTRENGQWVQCPVEPRYGISVPR